MKYLKNISENLQEDDFRSLFEFVTDDVSLDIDYSPKKHKDIDDIRGTCDITWKCDFNFFKNKGVEIYPYIKKIDFTFFVDRYIDNEENTKEIEEEYTLEYDGENIKIEWSNHEYDSITFMPNTIVFDYDKKTAVINF